MESSSTVIARAGAAAQVPIQTAAPAQINARMFMAYPPADLGGQMHAHGQLWTTGTFHRSDQCPAEPACHAAEKTAGDETG